MRPPSQSTSLRTTLLQDPSSTSTNRYQAVQSIKDSSNGLHRDHVLLDPAYMATNGSTAVGDLRVQATLVNGPGHPDVLFFQ
jgi:hypothetical protein